MTDGAGTGAAGFTAASAAASSGLPGCAASADCLAANGTGAGGGAALATTGRFDASAGGLKPGAAAPRTLACTGATAATAVTGAFAIASLDSRTALRPTGCDCTNVVLGTATIAPGTC
ncbi:MAG: hypothetical protein EPN19_05235 [Betaproteobacteria bacterium]|nr:MAG: hypothetical protein EPN19_05235 [Betaproteobacteria bacterium]